MNDYFNQAETDRRLAGLLRAGVISEVQLGDTSTPARCRVTVDDWTSGWLPFKAGSAGAVRTWLPPVVGEQVVMMAPSGDVAEIGRAHV